MGLLLPFGGGLESGLGFGEEQGGSGLGAGGVGEGGVGWRLRFASGAVGDRMGATVVWRGAAMAIRNWVVLEIRGHLKYVVSGKW